jgi:uncharacterized phage protein gp47/JayE
MFQIYGPNINVDPNSPDGQLINIFAQAAVDLEELLAQIYSSFDPDQAIGRVLDARCAINGVVRQAGTYTQQPVTVTVDRAITIAGLDTAPDAPFTVSDSAGNRFLLVSTYSFGGAGNASLAFRAEKLGPIQTTLNTITTIVSVTLGIVSVNNPLVASQVGTAEETDAALRIRRQNSVALPSHGYLAGLLGALQDTTGVLQAIVLENITNVVDANAIPAHGIWAIVSGGADADIALAIYNKRSMGCAMKGAVSINVVQPDGTNFAVLFDRPTAQPLWIKFNAAAVTGTLDATYIRTQLMAQLAYNIGQSADASAIIAMVKAIAPNISFSVEGVSPDGMTYSSLLAPTGVNYQFAISSPHILINGAPGP